MWGGAARHGWLLVLRALQDGGRRQVLVGSVDEGEIILAHLDHGGGVTFHVQAGLLQVIQVGARGTSRRLELLVTDACLVQVFGAVPQVLLHPLRERLECGGLPLVGICSLKTLHS